MDIKALRSIWWGDNSLLPTAPRWLTLLFAFFLCLYAFFMMTADAVGDPAQKITVSSGFVAWLYYGGKLRKTAVAWLFLAAVLIPFASWCGALLQHPQWAESSPKVHRLTSWFIFIPVAVWLGGKERNVFILWGVALLGLVAAPWLSGAGLAEIQRGFAGGRIDFGLHNAQHMGMLYAVALLGLVVFHRRFLLPWNRWGLLRLFIWLSLLFVCSSAVVFSQSRGVWLGLACAIIGSLFAAIKLSDNRQLRVAKLFKLSYVALFVLLLVFINISSFKEIVQKRIIAEVPVIEQLADGNIDDIGFTSIGIRLHSWQEAFSWIEKRPFLGWGGEGRKLVIQESPIQGRYHHLHSSYFDLLVNYGLLGGFLLAGLFIWFFSQSLKARSNGAVPADVVFFALLFMFFWLVVNVFESYMFYSSGIYVCGLIFGGLASLIWKPHPKKN